MSAQVMTVTGPVPADRLGITLPHEHLIFCGARETGASKSMLNEIPLAVEEVTCFRDAGGSTIVDVTSRNLGRYPFGLKRIARETGLSIIMGCGWYREPFFDPEVYEKSTSQLAEGIVREITEGVGGTGVHAGIIGEIGNGEIPRPQYSIPPAEERPFRAAARAQKRTGLTITTHTYLAPIGLEQLDLLEEEGVDLRRVIVGHCDSVPEPDYHEAPARRGAWVQFDLPQGTCNYEVEKRVRLVKEFLSRGYLRWLLLSHDVSKKDDLHAYGGTDYDYLLTGFVPLLRETGLSDEIVHILLVEDPCAALVGNENG